MKLCQIRKKSFWRFFNDLFLQAISGSSEAYFKDSYNIYRSLERWMYGYIFFYEIFSDFQLNSWQLHEEISQISL